MRRVASGRGRPGLAALAGIVLTGVAALGVAPRWDAASQQRELDALGESRRLVVQMALGDLEGMVEAMASHLGGSALPIRPADFASFAADAFQAYGGTVELGWLAPRGALAPPGDAQRVPDYGLAFVTAPLALGGGEPDAAAQNELRAALLLASERSGLAATPPLALGPGTDAPRVVVAYAAVIAPAARGRPAVVAGFVRCRFEPGALADHVLAGVQVPRGLDVHLFQAGAGPDDVAFHVRGSLLRTGEPPRRTLAQLEARPHWRATVSFADARWTLLAAPMPGGPLAVGHVRSAVVALVGLLLTALLVAYVASVGTQEEDLSRAASLSRADAAAARYRGELLHAIATAATELAATERIDEAMGRALRAVGEAALVDRVVVLEEVGAGDGRPAALVTRHVWRSALAPPVLPGAPVGAPAPSVEPAAHLLAFAQGRPYAAVVSAMPSPLREYLTSLGVRSVLIVPMTVEGRRWGALTLDDCTTDREWTAAEIDILQTLSDLVATSIARARHVRELADANTIVENSTTILYRVRGESPPPLSYVSRNVAAMGHDPEALLREPFSYLALVHPEDLGGVRAGLDRVLHEGSGPLVRELRLRVWGGSYRWFESRHAPVRDGAGRIVEVEGILVDVTERKKAEERIAIMARTDPLTGVANRATFLERLELAFGSAARNHRPFSVLYLDLDRFKEVNDTLGHAAGDALITSVAQRLVETTRRTDLVARLGGDEFAVLQADVTDAAGAGILAAKIRGALSEPHDVAGRQLRVTVSVGVALWSRAVPGPGELLAQADAALYLAKAEGRDRYRFHSEALDREVRLHAALGEELRGALEREELELHYQPQVELATGRIVGMEALLRWHHSARGLLGPAEFLPAAERSGAILAVSRWVIERACRQLAEWRREGVAPPSLAVNVSLAELRAGAELVDAISDALERWELPPDALELDVTEATLVQAARRSVGTLERLRALGVRIAVDDFGAQASSLDHLRGGRVSRLTIPRSIVQAVRHDPGEAAMIRAIISTAEALDLEVVAQGIETGPQRDLLAGISDALRGQGFFFSRPVPAEGATELLRAAAEPAVGAGAAPRAGPAERGAAHP